MDPMLYFTFFTVCLAVCAACAVLGKPPTRPCPACGLATATSGRRCRHCSYRFS